MHPYGGLSVLCCDTFIPSANWVRCAPAATVGMAASRAEACRVSAVTFDQRRGVPPRACRSRSIPGEPADESGVGSAEPPATHARTPRIHRDDGSCRRPERPDDRRDAAGVGLSRSAPRAVRSKSSISPRARNAISCWPPEDDSKPIEKTCTSIQEDALRPLQRQALKQARFGSMYQCRSQEGREPT